MLKTKRQSGKTIDHRSTHETELIANQTFFSYKTRGKSIKRLKENFFARGKSLPGRHIHSLQKEDFTQHFRTNTKYTTRKERTADLNLLKT